jgi:hypothetical protein
MKGTILFTLGLAFGFVWGHWVGQSDTRALRTARSACTPRTSLVIATQSGEVLTCLSGSARATRHISPRP